jgi:hypothetical protein
MRQPQPVSQSLLPALHRAVIGFVIVSRKMQQAMQHQDLDFCAERVAAFLSLPARCGNADRQIAGNPLGFPRTGFPGSRSFGDLGDHSRLKRQHICRFVLPAKLPV